MALDPATEAALQQSLERHQYGMTVRELELLIEGRLPAERAALALALLEQAELALVADHHEPVHLAAQMMRRARWILAHTTWLVAVP